MSIISSDILVITGPTAAGKTAVGALLAARLGGEVISADSMQIYRGMDIGTAKPTAAEGLGVPHHLLDVADPGEDWSVSRWAQAAGRCADDILSRGRVPVVVGGTGLYIQALLTGRDYAPAPGDSGLRRQLGAEYDALGGAALLERLGAVDPERAAKLSPNDKKRVLRALEVYALTGETITQHDRRTAALPPRYSSRRFALSYRQRETLYARIDERVDAMVSAGLFEEVRRLLAGGLAPGSTAMQAIGYKEVAAALRGELTGEEAVETVKRETRRYAKRQLTWLRRDEGLRWLFREDCPEPAEAVDRICQMLRQESTDFAQPRV